MTRRLPHKEYRIISDYDCANANLTPLQLSLWHGLLEPSNAQVHPRPDGAKRRQGRRVEPIVGRHLASIEMCDLWRKRTLIFSICRSEMRHLVCVRLHEGRASRSARDIVTTGRVSRQPVEPVDKAQHIRHEYVGDGEGFG